MEEQQKPVYCYYNTINGGYVPEMRVAGTKLNEHMQYGKGAYLSVSQNAVLGVDYTKGSEEAWTMQDCVRLNDQYYTMDQFVELVASEIDTKDVELVRSTLDFLRRQRFGEIAPETDLHDALGVSRIKYADRERLRVVDTILFSMGQNFSSRTLPELTGFTFEPREVLTDCLQSYRADVRTLENIVDGTRTLEQERCMKDYGPVGALCAIHGINGDIDSVSVTTAELDAFIDVAQKFIHSVKNSAVITNIDSERVTDRYQHIVDLVNNGVTGICDTHHPELQEKLSEYETLIRCRRQHKKAHDEVYAYYRDGKQPPVDVRKKLPTIPDEKRTLQQLVRTSKELVSWYMNEYPIADIYRALTETVPNEQLPERLQKIQEVLGFNAFAAPVVTQDMLEPHDDMLHIAQYLSDGKSQMIPNKAMEIQIVVLDPETVKPIQRMGVDTKGKWEEMSADVDTVVSKTSTTRYPKSILASLDKMELFQPVIYKGEDRIGVNMSAAEKVSAREGFVLANLFQEHGIEFQTVDTNGEETYLISRETQENYEKVRRMMRRAHLEGKNLPRGVLSAKGQNENA